MKNHTQKRNRQYPYSKNQVYLSSAIFLLSLVLALLLLASDLYLIIYYVVSTIIMTAATLLLKARLYSLITRDEETQNDGDKTNWKTLIIALSMLVGSVLAPMLLAGALSGASWFILIISFTSGVSASEIIYYLQTR